jgi:hypothetical protein
VSDLGDHLRALGLLAVSFALDDIVALATKKRDGAPPRVVDELRFLAFDNRNAD